jgi:hypothetical protein
LFDLRCGELIGHDVAVAFGGGAVGGGAVAGGGKGEPFIGLHVVLLHALAVGVEQAEVALGEGVAAFGRLGIPARRLGKVLFDAVTFGILALGIEQGRPASAKRSPVAHSLRRAGFRFAKRDCAVSTLSL